MYEHRQKIPIVTNFVLSVYQSRTRVHSDVFWMVLCRLVDDYTGQKGTGRPSSRFRCSGRQWEIAACLHIHAPTVPVRGQWSECQGWTAERGDSGRRICPEPGHPSDESHPDAAPSAEHICSMLPSCSLSDIGLDSNWLPPNCLDKSWRFCNIGKEHAVFIGTAGRRPTRSPIVTGTVFLSHHSFWATVGN